MARISWRSDVLGCGGVTPNPMMSSFNRQCRLPDSKVIRLALCSLPLNGDGKKIVAHKFTITVTFYYIFLSLVFPLCTGGFLADL